MKKTTNRFHNGIRLKYYRLGKFYVAQNGTYAETQKDGTEIPIHTGRDGSKYVDVSDEFGDAEKHYIDYAVASAFIKKANDNIYIVHHKDQDLGNCNADNLEWVLGSDCPSVSDEVVLDRKLIVCKDGKILHNGLLAQVTDHDFDSDVDCWYCFGIPRAVVYFTDEYDFLDIDNLMETAGYVHGDKKNFTRPVILHKDMDYSNFHSDNLEYIEATDQRYSTYIDKLKEYKHQRNIELNRGRQLPLGW